MIYSCIHAFSTSATQPGAPAVVGEDQGEGNLEGEAGSSGGAGPSDLTQACAAEYQTILFAAIERDHLLQATPSEPFFSRTPTPTSPKSPPTYSSR